MQTNTNYLLGIVVAVEDHELLKHSKERREIVADVPGVMQGILAHPKSSELDEPKVGDPVILECLDPLYHSYYTYYKLKENNFIGIRASGKAISITPDEITIGVFDKKTDYADGETPEMKAKIVIDAEGNIEINAGGKNITVYEASLTTQGGIASPGSKPEGGFCAIPMCPYTGTVHTGKTVAGIGPKPGK